MSEYECDQPSQHLNVTDQTAKAHIQSRLTTPTPPHQWNERQPDEHGCLDCTCGEHTHNWHDLLDHIDSGGRTFMERRRPDLCGTPYQAHKIRTMSVHGAGLCERCGEKMSWGNTCNECLHHVCTHKSMKTFMDPDGESGSIQAHCTVCDKDCTPFEW